MKKPRLHVALVGAVWDKSIEFPIIRRSVDELLLVYYSIVKEEAEPFIDKLQGMGIKITPLPIQSDNFEDILARFLRALNECRYDKYHIEFNITSANNVLVLVACVAATMLRATILYTSATERHDLTEVWPAELQHLTPKKMKILGFLGERAGAVPQKDISWELDIPRSGVSRQLRDLEHTGYVVRRTQSREKQVTITNLGEIVLHNKLLRKRRIWSIERSNEISSCQSDNVTFSQATSPARVEAANPSLSQ